MVQTNKGQGTSFHIMLPVTIATFRGVLIKCGGELLVVPTNEIDRVAKVPFGEVKETQLGQTIAVDGHEVPIVRLDRILELPTGAQRQQPYHLVMILHNAKQTIAFIIDDVLEEQEVLVKQFSLRFTGPSSCRRHYFRQRQTSGDSQCLRHDEIGKPVRPGEQRHRI